MNLFTEVQQYGSNEAELKDRPWLQDGVAPQVREVIPNIGDNASAIIYKQVEESLLIGSSGEIVT